MHRGWIKIQRKIAEWEWYADSRMVHLFIHLIITANHKDGRWKGIDIKRGELITGRKKLSETLNISEQQVRTCLNRLVDSKEITIKSTNKYSVVTVCNYDVYQEKEDLTNQQTNQQITNKQPTDNQQITTNKNYKECIKNIKEKYIYNSFYDVELKKSNNDLNYENFIKFIFGKNELGEPLTNVLKLKQVTYEQFKELWNKKMKHGLSLSHYLVQMENYKPLTKNNQYVSRTLHNWINRDLKK